MKAFESVLLILCLGLAILVGILAQKLVHARNEECYFCRKVEELSAREERLIEEFKLKQDHMRKIISDSDFVEQLIRDKTGLSKPNEMIFKFED